MNTSNECIISDAAYERKIHAAKRGSSVTVVWNPGAETSKKLGDIHEGGYKTFVCIEAVNAYNDIVTLAPNGHHSPPFCYLELNSIPAYLYGVVQTPFQGVSKKT